MKVGFRVGLLCLALLVSNIGLSAPYGEKSYLRIERNNPSADAPRITSIGGIGLNSGQIGHIDVSYIESLTEGSAVAIDLGAGVTAQAGVTFFMGAGTTPWLQQA